MTPAAVLQADEVRQANPDWLIWHVGAHWWAMRRGTAVTVTAADLDELSDLIMEADA
jgi:hypothetical protein